MKLTYEKNKEMTFIGYHTEIKPDEGYIKCPEFWDKGFNEKYARLWQTMKPETPIEEAILSNGIGMFAICAESENGFEYWIAGLYQGGDVPFLCKELKKGYLDGISGVYQTPQGYYVDDAEVEEFDKQFPYKEKLKLPGQIF